MKRNTSKNSRTKGALLLLLGIAGIVVIVLCFIHALPSPSFLFTVNCILLLLLSIKNIKQGINFLRESRNPAEM